MPWREQYELSAIVRESWWQHAAAVAQTGTAGRYLGLVADARGCGETADHGSNHLATRNVKARTGIEGDSPRGAFGD
jgi:hypothetical protein